MMSGFNMGGGWIGMGIWWVLLVVLLIAGAGFLFGRVRDGDMTSSSRSARDILDQRYARGEIDLNDYEERKRHLSE